MDIQKLSADPDYDPIHKYPSDVQDFTHLPDMMLEDSNFNSSSYNQSKEGSSYYQIRNKRLVQAQDEFSKINEELDEEEDDAFHQQQESLYNNKYSSNEHIHQAFNSDYKRNHKNKYFKESSIIARFNLTENDAAKHICLPDIEIISVE